MCIKISKLTENIFSLITLKGLQYVLNFLLLPYLILTLGTSKYGLVVYVQSIIQYFVIAVDYGFNLTGPKDIASSLSTNDRSYKFSSILYTKLFILMLIVFLLCPVFWFISSFFREECILFGFCFTMVIGNVMFPVWYFQGIQQMRYITLVNFFAKCIVVMLIFIFVCDENDYRLAALIISSETVLSGIFSFYIIRKHFKGILIEPSINMIRTEITSGLHIFLSTVSINIYTTSNIVFLGILTDSSCVGYFSAANKIIDGIKGVMVAVTQAVYPHISSMISTSKENALAFLIKFRNIYIAGCFTVSLFLYFSSEIIVKVLFGNTFHETLIVLRIMSSLPFIISISNVYGINTLVPFGDQKLFSRILCFAALIDCLLVYPFTVLYSSRGIACLMVLVEAIISILCFITVKKRHLLN